LTAYGPLTDETGARRFKLSLRGGTSGRWIARIEGIADRNAAEALRGTHLYVARAALPALEPGEFYSGDLLGLECVDGTGAVFGTVKALHNFGAGDVIEIDRPGGGSVLFAFTRATVPEIELARGRLVVAPPPEVDVGPENKDHAADTSAASAEARP
jgi:16S rRNA processing protein RimM